MINSIWPSGKSSYWECQPGTVGVPQTVGPTDARSSKASGTSAIHRPAGNPAIEMGAWG